MADETDDIEIKLAIDSVGAEKSVKEIKEALKDLKSVKAGSAMFDDAQKAAAEYKDKLEDLTDATKTLKGSGIEKLTGSMSLLKDGFINADPGKLGIAMKGLGSAMKAIPIFLIIEGIRYLVENFEKLTNSGGLLGKVFSFIGDVVGAVIQAFKDFTDWLGITNNAIEDNAELQIESAKKTQDAVTSRYDAEIRLAKAAGKETFDLEIKKQQAVINSARVQFEAIKAVAAASGEVTKEQEESVLALGKMIRDANLEIQVMSIEHEKKIEDIAREASKTRIAGKGEELEELQKIETDHIDLLVTKSIDKEMTLRVVEGETDEIRRVRREREKEEERQKVSDTLSIAKAGNDGLIGLSDLYFAVKSANTKKGSDEELRAAKAQFKISKALSLSSATVTGIQSVMSAYANGVKNPVPLLGPATGAAYAVIAGITAAANIAKIAGTQFGGGGSGGVSTATPSAPSTSSFAGGVSSSAPVAPSFALFGNSTGNENANNVSNQGSAQQPSVIKAYVVGQEITDQQTADKYSSKMGEL